MKIALVSQEYPPETAKGGIGTQTFIKAQGLRSLGHEVFVVSRSVDCQRTETNDASITIIRIPGFENCIYEMTEIVQWITYSALVAAELETLHERVNLDLIDFPEWAAEGYVYLLNRTEWKSVPVVIQLHGPLVMFGHRLEWPDIKSSFFQTGILMEASCVQLADAVYSSSRCSTEWIKQYYKPGTDNIPTIHLGVDSTKFFPQPCSKDERHTILFSGKVVPNKGIEELVHAAISLVKDFPDLCLRILGRGEENYIQYLNEMAANLDAPFLLQFPGFVQKAHLPEELSKAHVFAAPSWYEGGPGFVYLEAMACGLPVIGCSGSGIDEIVTSGENGILVPPKDRKALENALRRVLVDKGFAEKMGRKARQYVEKEADSKYCLRKLEGFYSSVTKTKFVGA
jgi:glycosyltransferase involved in cell wall biosynthesis